MFPAARRPLGRFHKTSCMHQDIALLLFHKAGLQAMLQQYCSYTDQSPSPGFQHQTWSYKDQSRNRLIDSLLGVGVVYPMGTSRRRPHHH
jgi:hypothetical protein